MSIKTDQFVYISIKNIVINNSEDKLERKNDFDKYLFITIEEARECLKILDGILGKIEEINKIGTDYQLKDLDLNVIGDAAGVYNELKEELYWKITDINSEISNEID